MLRAEKMKGGEREIENCHGEKSSIISNEYINKKMLRGFCDVGSSSDHTPFVDHSFDCGNGTTSLGDSWYRRVNNGNGNGNGNVGVGGVMLDDVGLSREFHRMNVGNGYRSSGVDIDAGRLGRDLDGFWINDSTNVGKIRVSNGECFDGGYGVNELNYGDNRSVIHKDEMMGFMYGQRGVNVGESLESIVAQNQSRVPYDGVGHQNCVIDFPLDEPPIQRDEYYGNFIPVLRGNKLYDDGMLRRKSSDCFGNGGMDHHHHHLHSLSEHACKGGLVSREDGGGYGNGNGNGNGSDVPLQFQSMYGPHAVGDPLQQYMMDGCKDVYNSWPGPHNVSMYNPYTDEALLQQCGGQFCGNMGGLNSLDSSQLLYSKQALSRGNLLYNSTREKMMGAEVRDVSSSVALMKRVRPLKSYGCESTLIMKEKGLSGGIGKSNQSIGRVNSLIGSTMHKIGERGSDLSGQLQSERSYGSGSHLMNCDPLMLYSLAKVQGNIYIMAKDQHGCRFLQKKFDEGTLEDVQLIFNGIIDHVVELMMNPFGNYLIQKLLDVCNDDQRMRIVLMVTKDRGELVRISLNTHGTRVVQKLIESLTTRKQTLLVIQALEPGFLDLIKDLNGNHVVQRCLQCLSSDENKFIFDAAAKFCVEIATHRHGCCVLQRCIAFSSGEQRKKLVDEICRNGLQLAQDPFGNYVVQYIIEQKIPSASAQLITQFEEHYVHLSMQKFSSHVVEKCLKFIEESHPRIVYELLSVSHFEQLLQDPFANYVIQSALEVTKGALNESLASAVRPHSILRTNPYCKKIFTRGLLKK